MVMVSPIEPTTLTSSSDGARLVATDGRELPLSGVRLDAEAGGGIARVRLTQRFTNPYDQPLEVRYLLPLPSDGAVSGFAFTVGEQRVVGEVAGKQEARERFQRALSQGRTAALLEQERTSLFTQRVGNIPPRQEVVAELVIDQPLRWLDEGAWEWRFPTVVAPRYLGAPGRVADAAALTVPVAATELGLRASLALVIADRLTGAVESPSHDVTTREAQVLLEGTRLDRDVVVRWPVALPDVSASVLAARPATAAHDGDGFALLTVAPPTGGWNAVPRDLTFLLDTSGSMSGFPLDQARRVVLAMLDTLGVNDRLELIEFGSSPRRWKDAPQPATETNKQAARRWVQKLQAGGGTEMHTAVMEALRPLRADSQRQVVLVTDGLIGFEQEIVRTLLTNLPAGVRMHAVGVGSGINRSLTQAVARAGRGTELIIGVSDGGLGEEAERLVARLVARTTAPLVTELVVEGQGLLEVAPRQLPDLYAEAPALIALRVSSSAAERGGEVVVRGHTADGPFERRLTLPSRDRGQGPSGVVALFAREKVEDLEMALTAGGDRSELDRAIEDTGVAFQIATRLTSWVAVSKQVTVDPYAASRTVEQPHELPHGMSAEGLGLRRAAAPAGMERYQDVKTVGQGGMGMVYEATDRVTGKRVMIKSMAPLPEEPQEQAESREELILEDSTSDTVIHIGDLMGGEKGGKKQEVIFDSTDGPAANRPLDPGTLRRLAERSPGTLFGSSLRTEAGHYAGPPPHEVGGADEGEAFDLTSDSSRLSLNSTGYVKSGGRPLTRSGTRAPYPHQALAGSRGPAKGRPRRALWILLLLALLALLALWRAGVLSGGTDTKAPQDRGVGPR